MTALSACLLVLVALGVAERLARNRAWRAVPVRVHVNGSRGKSTVTRLVWSALREAGVPALAKTTGTAARVLLPDGREVPLGRRGPASIREQLALLRRARRLGARAVVVECMALDPELQWVSERDMVRATVGVVTNVRLDHTEIMGGDLPTIAATLANTIPRSGVLVTGDERFVPLFEARAARLGTRLVLASRGLPAIPLEAGSHTTAVERPAAAPWLEEDMAVALAVTRELGIDDGAAIRGFARAPRDPGAARQGTAVSRGHHLHWLDATAANDPDSLAALIAETAGAGETTGRPQVLVYNHRHDRAPRLACFASHSKALETADRLILTGARPPLGLVRRLKQLRGVRPTRFVPLRKLAGALRDQPTGTRVCFCGNTRGIDLTGLLREVGADG